MLWNYMFDPMHNAVDHYYTVNSSLAGSWKGLYKDVGIGHWLDVFYGEKVWTCPVLSDIFVAVL